MGSRSNLGLNPPLFFPDREQGGGLIQGYGLIHTTLFHKISVPEVLIQANLKTPPTPSPPPDLFMKRPILPIFFADLLGFPAGNYVFHHLMTRVTIQLRTKKIKFGMIFVDNLYTVWDFHLRNLRINGNLQFLRVKFESHLKLKVSVEFAALL